MIKRVKCWNQLCSNWDGRLVKAALDKCYLILSYWTTQNPRIGALGFRGWHHSAPRGAGQRIPLTSYSQGSFSAVGPVHPNTSFALHWEGWKWVQLQSQSRSCLVIPSQPQALQAQQKLQALHKRNAIGRNFSLLGSQKPYCMKNVASFASFTLRQRCSESRACSTFNAQSNLVLVSFQSFMSYQWEGKMPRWTASM